MTAPGQDAKLRVESRIPHVVLRRAVEISLAVAMTYAQMVLRARQAQRPTRSASAVTDRGRRDRIILS
jgi:hypothetical protein